MEEKVKKCSICDADMPLVGYVDKDSKEDIGIEPTEKFRMPGGFLSGSLRKYKCPNGHEATNEESESKSKVDSFEDAEKLVGYMESHVETPRALVLGKHLIYLEYLAGLDVTKIDKETLEYKQFISLHECPSLIKDARKRLDNGLIPKNWLELLNKQIDSQSSPTTVV